VRDSDALSWSEVQARIDEAEGESSIIAHLEDILYGVSTRHDLAWAWRESHNIPGPVTDRTAEIAAIRGATAVADDRSPPSDESLV